VRSIDEWMSLMHSNRSLVDVYVLVEMQLWKIVIERSKAWNALQRI